MSATTPQADFAQIVAAMSADLDQLSDYLSDTIHDHLTELDDDLRVMTGQSVRANLGLIVTMLRERRAASQAVAPEEALAYVREYVRRGLELDLLHRAYRIAQAALSRLVLERVRSTTDDPDHLVETYSVFNDFLFAWVEQIERQLLEVYLREHEQWVRSAAAMRAADVRALLDGARADVPGIGHRLGYELDREHLAFVVWGEDDAAPTELWHMERVAAGVADALAAHAMVMVPLGRHLACWAALAGEPDCDPLAALPCPPQLHIAFGTQATGVEGFCLSYREAMLARRISRLARGRAATTTFSAVALDVLATHDPEEARRFVARELGPLAADDDAARRMSSTLRVFLDEGSSYVRAARRLGVHENTVTYRVHRAEELLGHPTTERQLELRVALRLARLLPRPAAP